MHDDNIQHDIIQHDDIHELLALRLYGELEAGDVSRVEAHLAECAACRTFAGELEHGLGRVAMASADDLPGDWRARLEREVAASPPASPARGVVAPQSFLLGTALGLAAGLLVAWGLIVAMPSKDAAPQPTYVASNGSADGAPVEVALATLPPKAQAGGELARLSLYLRK